MTIKDLIQSIYFDEGEYISNPYFFIRDYEDKGVVVALKKEKNFRVNYKDLLDVCFECPDMEIHEGILQMVLFHLDENMSIYKYSIASSKSKILRSDILKYEALVGKTIEVK
jgi:hypothetical protein